MLIRNGGWAAAVSLALTACLSMTGAAWAQATGTQPTQERERESQTEDQQRERQAEAQDSERAARAERARRLRAQRAREQRADRRAESRPAANDKPASEVITLDPAIIDFGICERSSLQEADVTITNISDHPIELGTPKSSCSCTVPALPKTALAPGESVDMHIKLELGWNMLPVHKSVAVFVEDYGVPVTLPVRAHPSYVVTVNPAYVSSQDRSRGGPLSGRLVLEATDGRPFRVLAMNGEPPVVLEPTPQRGEEAVRWVITYDLQEDIPPYLLIDTDHPGAPVIDIKVAHMDVAKEEAKYRHNTAIRLLQSALNLGLMAPGAPEVAKVEFLRRGRDTDQPLTLRSGAEAVKVELLGVEPSVGSKGREQETITLRLTSSLRDGPAQLVPIYIAEGEQPESRIWLIFRPGAASERAEHVEHAEPADRAARRADHPR